MALSPNEVQEVYDVARSLRPAAESFARRFRLDDIRAEDLLMEAADKVLTVRELRPETIVNLPAYLFTTYKHLLVAFARKAERELPLEGDTESELSNQYNAAEEIERTILIEEVAHNMNEQSRFIFQHRLIGYSYKEIAELYRSKFGGRAQENALRSKYNKTVNRLVTELTTGKSE